MLLPTVPSAEYGVEGHVILDTVVPEQKNCAGRFSFLSLRNRLLVLGGGMLAADLIQALKARRFSFTQVVGYVDKDRGLEARRSHSPLFLGTIDRLFEIVERWQIHTVAVCLEDQRATLPVQTLLDIKTMGLEVVDGHRLLEKGSGRLLIDCLRPSALIFSTGFRRRMLTGLTKRLFDLIASVGGLIILLPLFVLVGLLIKLDSSGPVFYRQMRVGLRGQPYMIWKFRSMSKDAEKRGPQWAEIKDPRVSRVGRWLRKLRIDELPQLINVLVGEMSLVGPRPERPMFVQDLRAKISYYDIRHTVRPGITGWAQVRFRYGASAEDAHRKLQYDLFYVKNMSPALDLLILMETLSVVLFCKGAR